jgi:phenylpropionate dioxygenase-like ring-hydroxylating dioxygenase large terminal subunit/DNA-binding transcriptional regulator YbjK
MAANLESSAELRPTGSKLDLIIATVAAISRHGLSEVTSAKIAGAAGHTAASINFHFGSKEALLLATLSEVSEEFAEVMATVLEEAGDDDLRGLLGIVDASLSRRLSNSQKIAVWYAFLAETNARADYQRICGGRDQAYSQTVTKFCTRLIAARAIAGWPDAEAVSLGLTGLIDQQWQGILFEGDDFNREAAKRQCRAYLCSVFPWLAERIEATAQARMRPAVPEPAVSVDSAVSADPSLRYTLPAWVYHNEEFHELEKERIFLPSWQVVCHVSELATTGDFVAFEFFGQRGFVVRDESGTLRAFHNVCSHRAHAVVSGERGRCGKFLTCMYHGWTYHLDGRNRSVSAPDTFPKFDRSKFGLKPIELEVFMGMVFVRFQSGEPGVAERMAPHQAELAHYRMDQMVPLDDLWTRELEIDWKNVVENYVEDYHFPIGHPGLSALMESKYDREILPAGGTMRLSHRMREKPLKSWSAERYARFLPVIEHLPEDMRRRWTYFGLFPNVFFDIYPEWLDFFQLVPLGPGRTLIRARSYGFPDDSREMRAARFLCSRLNTRVQAEDEVLTRSVQHGLASGAYTQGILSDKEIVLAGFQDWIRARLPVTQLIQAPARGSVAARNAAFTS